MTSRLSTLEAGSLLLSYNHCPHDEDDHILEQQLRLVVPDLDGGAILECQESRIGSLVQRPLGLGDDGPVGVQVASARDDGKVADRQKPELTNRVAISP